MKETDLYPPIRRFLEAEGYSVHAEVRNCDVTATRDGQMVIIEMKKSFNLKLVYQALERQGLTEEVFVAIPRPTKGQRERSWKDMLKLLKRLEIGLLTVALDSPLETVDVVLTPSDSLAWKNRKKRQRLEQELSARAVSGNLGGMTRRKIMTAYREKALSLSCLLERRGQISLKELREEGRDPKYPALLQSNTYGWYTRVAKGQYMLSPLGWEALSSPDFAEVVTYYREKEEAEQ